MIIDVDAELMLSMVETATAAIDTVDALLTAPTLDPAALQNAMRAARSATAGMAMLTGQWFSDDDIDPADSVPDPISTDDPATCGHPHTWDMPDGSKMCTSCGDPNV